MAVVSKLKNGIINPFTFATNGPGVAKIYIELTYDEKWKYLLGYKGFKQEGELLGKLLISGINKLMGNLGVNYSISNPPDQAPIRFQMPVTPPTLQTDTGSGSDTNTVAQIGEVVLPKYAKAKQFRFESFFPYDSSAAYLNTTVRESNLRGLATTAANLVSNVAEITKAVASPQMYIDIFNELNKTKTPFKISMNFYQGGNLPWTQVTVNTFQYEPENNGDYKYQLSLMEWVDIAPTKLNTDGTPAFKSTVSLKDVIISFKNSANTTLGYASTISQWWNICKSAYSIVSKNLIFWVAKYNGIKNLSYIRKGDFTWKFKNEFSSYATRYSIQDNLIGKSKITSSDTAYVSESLKALSYTTASQQMAEYLKELGYNSSK